MMSSNERAVRAALRFAVGRISRASSIVDEIPHLGRDLQQFLADRRREMRRPPELAISQRALAAECVRLRSLAAGGRNEN